MTKKVKRQGNLLSFAFFGITAQAIALMLLAEPIGEKNAFGFLFAAVAFMVYRAYISEKKQGFEESRIKKELRRWWIREEPENTFSFALVGGMLLVACNFVILAQYRPIDVWAMSFVSIGLTQVLFESSRREFNRLNAYLLQKRKEKRLMEVKKAYEYNGYGKKAQRSSN